MMTTKKRSRFHNNVVVVGALGALLTACGPPGARELQQGEQYIQAGQFADAVVALRDATRILSEAPHAVQAKAWNLLGVACQDSGQLEDAAKAYTLALKLDRDNAAIDYNLGCLRGQQTNFMGAIDYLTTYVALRPRDPQGYLQLGRAHFHCALERTGTERSRLLEGARRDFENAEKVGASAEAANELGILEWQHRSPSAESIHASAQDFALAVRRDPHFAPALLNLAIVSQQYLNQPTQALNCYRQYLTVQPAPPHTNEVARLAHDLDMRLRIVIGPEPAPTRAPAPAPSPAPPSARMNAAPKPPPAQSTPAPVVFPAAAPALTQIAASTSTPPPPAETGRCYNIRVAALCSRNPLRVSTARHSHSRRPRASKTPGGRSRPRAAGGGLYAKHPGLQRRRRRRPDFL
jgi:tetratricopeptide (TPR) repeat protein